MNKTILIVDDTESIIEMLRFILEKNNYTVITANNGLQALECLDGRDVDLIITDLHMPKMNGIELTSSIRSLQYYRRAPILLLTTETQTSIKMEARDAGATAWLTKPFKAEQLLKTLKKLVR